MTQPLQALNHFFPPDFVASISEESFLYGLLCEQRSEAHIWRQHINGSLELALRYELPDADLEARLRKGDWETFAATVNELKCAKFLEGLFGTGALRWRPEGRQGKKGEFEVVSSKLGRPVFVEVKTIFPRDMEKLEGRVRRKLQRYAEQVDLPFMLSVQIKEVGLAEDFSGKKFKKFLEEELRKIGLIKLPDYIDDKTGLHLQIEAYPIPPKPPRSCYIGIISGKPRWVKNEDYIHHSLGKAYRQLPKGKQPCLVMLCSSTEFPIDQDDMLNALLGTLAASVPRFGDGTVGEVVPFRKPDGFYHPQRNSHASATAVYREKFTEEGIQSNLSIYHNPFALNPIDSSIFEGKGVRQLVKIDEGQMGWKD